MRLLPKAPKSMEQQPMDSHAHLNKHASPERQFQFVLAGRQHPLCRPLHAHLALLPAVWRAAQGLQHKQLQKGAQMRLNEFSDRVRNSPSPDLGAQVRGKPTCRPKITGASHAQWQTWLLTQVEALEPRHVAAQAHTKSHTKEQA